MLPSASSGFPAGSQGLGAAQEVQAKDTLAESSIQPGNCFHSSGQTFR